MDSKIQNLTFGVELELHLPRGTHVNTVCQAVALAIGKPCVMVPYHEAHATIATWKAVTDGSLDQAPNGWEFVSPVLKGEEGLAELKVVLETLIAQGAVIYRDCGTHVHVGVGSRNPDMNMLKRLLKAYATFEHAIDGIFPNSRRANNSYWCSTLAQIAIARIDGATTLGDLFSLFYHGRYHKLNLHSLVRRPTVEFRQHSGTLEYAKLANWILFCLRMVAASVDATIAVPVTEGGTPQTNRARYGSKSWQIGQLLLRAEGCTANEVMRAVNWPSVSMVQQARICGLQLVRQRMGRNVRFFARQISASTAIASGPATLERLLAMIDASQPERAFFAARQAHFAQRAAA
jgi:hypothetical protein